MKLVCLDDDPRMGPVLRRVAGRHGHDVHFYTASAAFKADVSRESPDLVVLDLGLGQESGIDIIDWLARARVNVPVVLLSGHGDALLDTARRIARASGVEVLAAVNKAQMVRDLTPVLTGGQPGHDEPSADLLPVPRLEPAELARHIAEGRIEPFFQPIVTAAGGRLRGAEVLARLRLPTGETIGALAIIPVAEASGLILPLTEALFARLIALKEQLRLLRLGFVAVNLSAATLDQQRAIAAVRGLIEGLADVCQVRVELTESAAIAGSQPMRELTAQINLLGASLSMDDFGTGYSCIRALSELPFDTLKIDLSFVSEMFESAKAHSMLRAIIGLGRNLGLKVVAEGVETEAQRRFLLNAGVDLIQGYLFGRPMDIDAFMKTYGSPLEAGGGAA